MEDATNNGGAKSNDSTSEDAQTMSSLVETIGAGKCILFLGAAIHCAPPNGEYSYSDQYRPTSASTLSADLARKTGFAKKFPNEGVADLKRVAQDYETKFQRSELIREIKTAVHVGKKPSPLLQMLAELDFPLVITTNYDQLFEDALRAVGKKPYVSVFKKNEEVEKMTDDYPFDEDPSANRPFILKIHGDVLEGSSIVITDEDYIQFVLRMGDKQEYHPVPETMRFYLKKWPTLFVGYSLRDYNLRLLFKTLRWKIDRGGFPLAYSVDLFPDPLVFDVYFQQRRYINFLVQDLWTFIPELHKQLKGS